MAQARTTSAVIVIDSGNALFKEAARADPVATERAQLILNAMGEMQVAAMAVGVRDLSAGLDFLKTEAQRSKVPLLSVNLVDAKGARTFPPSKIVSASGVRVGLIGASPYGAFEAARGLPPVAEVLREAKRLRSKADVVVVLAALPYADALQLAQESKGAVDFVIQSSENRGEGFPESMGKTFVLRSGERGRQVGVLELTLGRGNGAFADSGEKDRAQKTLRFLETQIESTRKRMETAPDENIRKSLAQTLANFESRRNSVAASLAPSATPEGRTFALSFINLGAEIPDDPQLAGKVARLEPPPSSGAPGTQGFTPHSP